jgi:hypothetical protein
MLGMISLEHQIFDPCAIDRPKPVRPKPVAMPFKTFLEACRPKLTNTEIAETIPTQIIADHLTNALRFGANRTIVPDVLRHAMKYYEGQVSAQPPRRKGKVKRAAERFHTAIGARMPDRLVGRMFAFLPKLYGDITCEYKKVLSSDFFYTPRQAGLLAQSRSLRGHLRL